MKNIRDGRCHCVPFVDGKKVFLRALCESDCSGTYISWLNDEEVCRGNSHHLFPYTESMARQYVESISCDRANLVLAISLKSDGRHIGNIALNSIDPVSRCADLAMVIGEKNSWGKGYGLEAAVLICRHGFDSLNLKRITCGTLATNIGMQRLASRLGMMKEGVRRKAAYKSGEYVDVVEYGMFKEEMRK